MIDHRDKAVPPIPDVPDVVDTPPPYTSSTSSASQQQSGTNGAGNSSRLGGAAFFSSLSSFASLGSHYAFSFGSSSASSSSGGTATPSTSAPISLSTTTSTTTPSLLAPTAATTMITRKRPPQIPRSNYIKISRKDNGVKETFVIDTELEVPEYMLSPNSNKEENESGWKRGRKRDNSGSPPLPPIPSEDGARKNLEIECPRDSINVEVWIVDDDMPYSPSIPQTALPQVGTGGQSTPTTTSISTETSPTTTNQTTFDPDAKRRSSISQVSPFRIRKPATIYIKGGNDSVTVNMHANANTPFHLVVSSRSGDIRVGLPSCFVGPVTTYSKGGDVSIDTSLAPFFSTYSDSDGTRKAFLGDFRASGYDGSPDWPGFTFNADTKNGKITLKYSEETVDLGQKSVWNRLFG